MRKHREASRECIREKDGASGSRCVRMNSQVAEEKEGDISVKKKGWDRCALLFVRRALFSETSECLFEAEITVFTSEREKERAEEEREKRNSKAAKDKIRKRDGGPREKVMKEEGRERERT